MDGEQRLPLGRGFRAMTEATPEQWSRIAAADAAFAASLPDWLLGHLTLLRDDRHGFDIDRLEHCLQTATRALRDGRDEDYVVCALMHDIGSALAPQEHAEFAAMILRPFVSEQNHWMLAHHGIFQGYYFLHFFGGDRNQRERFRGHPHFEHTAQFCHLYDQMAFDPGYQSLPLEAFEPMVRRVLAVRKR
ncbi:MAG TPA: HD domain-containing protein [Caulobacteraceae bacterium]|nr:HD domain-containing protein [Caulobacteraceae bacterium]